MKVNISQILGSMDALSLLTGTDMSINTAYKIASVIAEVEKVLRAYEPRKVELFKKYGVENKDDNSYTIPDIFVEVYTKEHNEILEEEVDLNIDNITIEMLGDINIKPATLIALKWLIET